MDEQGVPSQDSHNTAEENAGMYVPADDSPLARLIAEENERYQRRMRAQQGN